MLFLIDIQKGNSLSALQKQVTKLRKLSEIAKYILPFPK